MTLHIGNTWKGLNRVVWIGRGLSWDGLSWGVWVRGLSWKGLRREGLSWGVRIGRSWTVSWRCLKCPGVWTIQGSQSGGVWVGGSDLGGLRWNGLSWGVWIGGVYQVWIVQGSGLAGGLNWGSLNREGSELGWSELGGVWIGRAWVGWSEMSRVWIDL